MEHLFKKPVVEECSVQDEVVTRPDFGDFRYTEHGTRLRLLNGRLIVFHS